MEMNLWPEVLASFWNWQDGVYFATAFAVLILLVRIMVREHKR